MKRKKLSEQQITLNKYCGLSIKECTISSYSWTDLLLWRSHQTAKTLKKKDRYHSKKDIFKSRDALAAKKIKLVALYKIQFLSEHFTPNWDNISKSALMRMKNTKATLISLFMSQCDIKFEKHKK